jgi:hypothetical protein
MLLYLTLFEKYHWRTLFVLAKLTRQKENLHPVGLKVDFTTCLLLLTTFIYFGQQQTPILLFINN